ncbi:attachment subunit-related family [Trichomonas vaginalis G3]|uniref:attachment subunit-related family n=1 Tax=Trichomonas vaginalis (strain ATCC PRA-98 / G3) TaxID=412133 RepID=UPI0021E6008E|nr:attachment subunit-related family [Trichomonas vaginalis G3]KAI5498806.1 attachment subunit-related family [Trichomonas vaginalis G3]
MEANTTDTAVTNSTLRRGQQMLLTTFFKQTPKVSQPTPSVEATIQGQSDSNSNSNQIPPNSTSNQPSNAPEQHTHVSTSQTTQQTQRQTSNSGTIGIVLTHEEEEEYLVEPEIKESDIRKDAVKRLEQFMKNYPQNLSIQDTNDYSDFYNDIIEAVKKFEDNVQNPTNLSEFFFKLLPYTGNIIGLQFCDEFIQTFGPRQQRSLYARLKLFHPYPLTYNWIEELQEHGKEQHFKFYVDVPQGKLAKTFTIQPKQFYEDFLHVISTIAMVEPERVTFGQSVSLYNVRQGLEPLKIAEFTSSSAQLKLDCEFQFVGNSKFSLHTPFNQRIRIFIAGYVGDPITNDDEEEISEEEEEEEENDSDVVLIE